MPSGLRRDDRRLAGCTAVARALTRVSHVVSAEARAKRSGHRGGVIWLTGLSGAGKSTIAIGAEARLFERGYHVYTLDGDNLRNGISADLGFSLEDRRENVRRASAVAALFADAGLVVLAALISPSAEDRALARAVCGDAFHEAYVSASLSVCEARDPRGLYRRARLGEIRQFTGISAPYDVPACPDLRLDSETHTVEECVDQLFQYVAKTMGSPTGLNPP